MSGTEGGIHDRCGCLQVAWPALSSAGRSRLVFFAADLIPASGSSHTGSYPRYIGATYDLSSTD